MVECGNKEGDRARRLDSKHIGINRKAAGSAPGWWHGRLRHGCV